MDVDHFNNQINVAYLLKGLDFQSAVGDNLDWQANLERTCKVKTLYNEAILVTPTQSFQLLIAEYSDQFIIEVLGCIISPTGRAMSSPIFLNSHRVNSKFDDTLQSKITTISEILAKRKQIDSWDVDQVKTIAISQLTVEYVLKRVRFDESLNSISGDHCNIHLVPREGDSVNKDDELDVLRRDVPDLKPLNWEAFLDKLQEDKKDSGTTTQLKVLSVSNGARAEPTVAINAASLLPPAVHTNGTDVNDTLEAENNGKIDESAISHNANNEDDSSCQSDSEEIPFSTKKKTKNKKKFNPNNPMLDFAGGIMDFIHKRNSIDANNSNNNKKRGSALRDSMESNGASVYSEDEDDEDEDAGSEKSLFSRMLKSWSGSVKYSLKRSGATANSPSHASSKLSSSTTSTENTQKSDSTKHGDLDSAKQRRPSSETPAVMEDLKESKSSSNNVCTVDPKAKNSIRNSAKLPSNAIVSELSKNSTVINSSHSTATEEEEGTVDADAELDNPEAVINRWAPRTKAKRGHTRASQILPISKFDDDDDDDD